MKRRWVKWRKVCRKAHLLVTPPEAPFAHAYTACAVRIPKAKAKASKAARCERCLQAIERREASSGS